MLRQTGHFAVHSVMLIPAFGIRLKSPSEYRRNPPKGCFGREENGLSPSLFGRKNSFRQQFRVLCVSFDKNVGFVLLYQNKSMLGEFLRRLRASEDRVPHGSHICDVIIKQSISRLYRLLCSPNQKPYVSPPLTCNRPADCDGTAEKQRFPFPRFRFDGTKLRIFRRKTGK